MGPLESENVRLHHPLRHLAAVVMLAMLMLLVLGYAAGSASAQGPAPTPDTITSTQTPGGLSQNSNAPTTLTVPLVLTGHTLGAASTYPPKAGGFEWYLIMYGGTTVSTQQYAYQHLVYCSNTPFTDPASGVGVYGTPPFDANGNWTCDIATDPNAATDGPMFTAAGWPPMFDPATALAGGPASPTPGQWELGNRWDAPTPWGSPDYYLQFAATVGAPVLWWPVAVPLMLVGTAGWVLMARRRRSAR